MAQLSAMKYIFSKHIHPLRNTHYWGLCSSQACSFLYLLMRSNFEFSGAQGCDRVQWKVSAIVQYFALILECPTKLYYFLLVCGMYSVIVKLHLYYADFFSVPITAKRPYQSFM